MAVLLVVHHSPGRSMPAMVIAVVAGASQEGLEEVDVRVVDALSVTAEEIREADGYVLATPANLGYMSGAMKHAFDTTYNEVIDHTSGRPYGVVVHGASDTTGALLGIEKITTGLGWRLALPPISVLGSVTQADLDACAELGGTVAALTL